MPTYRKATESDLRAICAPGEEVNAVHQQGDGADGSAEHMTPPPGWTLLSVREASQPIPLAPAIRASPRTTREPTSKATTTRFPGAHRSSIGRSPRPESPVRVLRRPSHGSNGARHWTRPFQAASQSSGETIRQVGKAMSASICAKTNRSFICWEATSSSRCESTSIPRPWCLPIDGPEHRRRNHLVRPDKPRPGCARSHGRG